MKNCLHNEGKKSDLDALMIANAGMEHVIAKAFRKLEDVIIKPKLKEIANYDVKQCI